MVLNFDRNPSRTIDEKLDSLIQNIQLALNEIENRLDAQDKRLDEIQKQVDSIGP